MEYEKAVKLEDRGAGHLQARATEADRNKKSWGNGLDAGFLAHQRYPWSRAFLRQQ